MPAKLSRLNLFICLTVVILLTSFLVPISTASAQEVKTAVTVPTPVAPSGTIWDKTPTYKWTRIIDSSKYQYRVFSSGATLPLWTKTAVNSACGTTYCLVTPAASLVAGKYTWQVRAYIGAAWKAWSVRKSFTVVDGFNSQFNGAMIGWATKAGGDWKAGSSWMYDNGVPYKWSSVSRTTQQYSDFTYSARVRQTGGNYEKNVVMVRMGTSVKALDNSWYPGYEFRWQNNGYFYIMRYNANGTTFTIQNTTFSAAIVDGWNTVKVIADGSNFKYYINGVLLKEFTDSTFSNGYVGFGWYKTWIIQPNTRWTGPSWSCYPERISLAFSRGTYPFETFPSTIFIKADRASLLRTWSPADRSDSLQALPRRKTANGMSSNIIKKSQDLATPAR